VEKKGSQFKQNAATVYETSVYIILTLGPGSQGNLVEVEKEARQFQQNAATLYQTARRMLKSRLGSKNGVRGFKGAGTKFLIKKFLITKLQRTKFLKKIPYHKIRK
jgi:hypothetical protein